MAANFMINTVSRGSVPIMAGAWLDVVDQAPTGAWVEVPFTIPENSNANQTRERVLHISTDVALRYAVAPAEPGGGEVGAQILAGVERTVGFAATDKLWIKS